MMTTCNPGGPGDYFYRRITKTTGADTILSGARPIYVPLHPPDFSFDPAELRAAFEQKANAIVLCNPSNPSGKVFSLEELETIAGLAREFDTFVITDEVYEHIVYPPYRHHYMAALPGMFERTLSCSPPVQNLQYDRVAAGLCDRSRNRSSPGPARFTIF